MCKIEDLFSQIKKFDNICIFTHVNPDGDTIGSCIALKMFLEKYFNKTARMFYTSFLPTVYSFLPEYNNFESITSFDNDIKCDLAIAVDIASIDRLAEAVNTYKNAKYKVNIDHHKTNDGYGDWNLIDGDACSVGLILARLFKESNFTITKDMATALYVSILTDTGAFKYENTSPECLEVAANLVEAGASPNAIYRACYESKPVNMVKFQSYILNKADFLLNEKFAITTVTKEDMQKFNASDDYTEGIVEVLRTAKNVEIAAILKETKEGYTKVSLRSKTFNLIKITETFGGGGHIFSAGCTIKKPVKVAYNKLLECVENAIK